MRKLFFVLVAAFAMSFTACNKNAEPTFGTATDSVSVDSTVVDTVVTDTVHTVVDTTAVDSVTK